MGIGEVPFPRILCPGHGVKFQQKRLLLKACIPQLESFGKNDFNLEVSMQKSYQLMRNVFKT